MVRDWAAAISIFSTRIRETWKGKGKTYRDTLTNGFGAPPRASLHQDRLRRDAIDLGNGHKRVLPTQLGEDADWEVLFLDFAWEW